MKNKLVSDIFRHIAEILEIKGENVFRIRAYQRAADTIEGIPEDIEQFVTEGRLTEIPGIGTDLAAKITELVSTGKLKFYEDLQETVPESVLQLLAIPDVGPRTAALLYERLKIKNIDDLERAISAGRLSGIPGIKDRTIENIRKGIAFLKRGRERMPLARALQVADGFVSALKRIEDVEQLSFAGSLRRSKETVRDIDILVVSSKPAKVMDAFIGAADKSQVLAKGETKASIRTAEDIQVDCRVVEKRSYGAALLYFTGSKDFNIRLRMIAQKKGWKINEYGVFDGKGKLLAGATEDRIFKLFKMQYIEPELRENSGEIELALKDSLPRLIELKDVKGDLHCHSDYSDGGNSIEEMALAAQERGYSYVAISDHSQSLKVANGVSVTDLAKKKKEIESVNRKLKNFRVLFGTEVDIDPEGRIDYPDEVLKGFDIVVAAIHLGFKQPKEKLTLRLVRACANKYVHIIAHPTGRLWGTRDAYELDMQELMKAARDTNTALEVNSFPDRLDLNDGNCRLAKKSGVRICINTDAHAVGHLGSMPLGVAVARRGWLEAVDVLNTLPLEKLLKVIKK
ncbi:MAG: DNA polymerase/3'-5' exonuclease PolX [Candidatus Omnitrophica bacterium]|nr:DNA polymerase/3'-5' exonuclease PolX [Candidatus Omnitrophota bacterium]